MLKAIDVVQRQPWAILPDSLETICNIALRNNEEPEAVAAKLGRDLDNTRTVTMRDGVAVVPVTGPIFRYANLFTRISGATSIDDLAIDFRTAMDDPEVKAIVLEIDSPGGQVNGINEFAEMVKAARGTKPITAYVGGYGASAAYWIAVAADQVVIEASASVGSIGVIAAFNAADDDGSIEIVSNQSPDKRLDVTEDDGRKKIQAHIDRLADVFVGFVADARGVSSDTVLSKFGQGGIVVGSDAVAAGMADGVGSLEGVISSLNKEENVMPGEDIKTTADITVDLIRAEHADIATTFSTEGAEAERQRIQAVLDQSVTGCEALIETLAFDGKTSGPEAAVQVLAALKEKGADALASIQNQAPEAITVDAEIEEDLPSADQEETDIVAAMAAGGDTVKGGMNNV